MNVQQMTETEADAQQMAGLEVETANGKYLGTVQEVTVHRYEGVTILTVLRPDGMRMPYEPGEVRVRTAPGA
jgi:sporulation protein YlmC with PRC-barrel domain